MSGTLLGRGGESVGNHVGSHFQLGSFEWIEAGTYHSFRSLGSGRTRSHHKQILYTTGGCLVGH